MRCGLPRALFAHLNVLQESVTAPYFVYPLTTWLDLLCTSSSAWKEVIKCLWFIIKAQRQQYKEHLYEEKNVIQHTFETYYHLALINGLMNVWFRIRSRIHEVGNGRMSSHTTSIQLQCRMQKGDRVKNNLPLLTLSRWTIFVCSVIIDPICCNRPVL